MSKHLNTDLLQTWTQVQFVRYLKAQCVRFLVIYFEKCTLKGHSYVCCSVQSSSHSHVLCLVWVKISHVSTEAQTGQTAMYLTHMFWILI